MGKKGKKVVWFDENGDSLETVPLSGAHGLKHFGNGVIAFNREGDALVFSEGQTYRIGIPPGI